MDQINDPYNQELFDFINEWESSNSFITVQTSGSTGSPKSIQVRKEQMINSAKISCEFFNLKKGDATLLCLPLSYIAGKMMVVRSIVADLELLPVSPVGNPLKYLDEKIDFAAMTPMQVYNTLHDPIELERLKQIPKLIIGGGPITLALSERLKDLPNEIYATYGMAETLSHIALRRLNGECISEYYTPLPGVTVSLNKGLNTLSIKAPNVCDTVINTNDLAEVLPDGRFRILGRIDNVVNSGGIKIHIEDLEDKIFSLFSDRTFVFTSQSDHKLGERLVLLIEKDPDMDVDVHVDVYDETLEKLFLRFIPKYHLPKKVYFVEKIPRTHSDKIDRSAVKELAKSL